MPLTSKRVASHRLAARLAEGDAGLGADPGPLDARDGRQVDLAEHRGDVTGGDGRGGGELGLLGARPGLRQGAQAVDGVRQQSGLGGEIGPVGVLRTGERDGRGPTGAGHAGDHGGRGLLPGAQHEQGGVVADPVDVVGGDELDPGVGAPAEPATHDVVRGLGAAVRGRPLHGLDHAAPRLQLVCRRLELLHRRGGALGIGEPGRLAGHQDPGPGPSGPGLAPATRDPRRQLVDGDEVVGADGHERVCGGRLGVRLRRRRAVRPGAETQRGDAGAASVLEGGPDALGVGDRGTAQHQGAHDGHRAAGGVRPTAGGAGTPDDGHARPADVGDVLAQRLEQRSDGRRGYLALHRELGGGQLQLRLGVVLREPDLAGHVGHRDVGELGEQEHLALGDRQLGERVEGRADVGVELAVAVEDPGRVAALRVPPGQRTDPGHGVLEPGHLAPVVPGGHERVAHRVARGRQIAGEREGLLEQRGTGRLVEVVELVCGLHGRSTVRGSPSRVHIPAGAFRCAAVRCAGLESRTVGRCRMHGFVAGAARRAHGHRWRRHRWRPPRPSPLMLLRPCLRQRPLCAARGERTTGRLPLKLGVPAGVLSNSRRGWWG